MTSSISQSGESDFFTFDGTTGQIVELMLTESGWPTGASAFATLFSPSGVDLGDFVSTSVTEFMLTPFDAEVSWVGSDLGFREWSLTVAEACSGSGTLLTLAVLSAFFAGIFRLRPAVTVAAVALTLPFAVFVNGLRIALTALILDWFGPSAVIGTGHLHPLAGGMRTLDMCIHEMLKPLLIILRNWAQR